MGRPEIDVIKVQAMNSVGIKHYDSKIYSFHGHADPFMGYDVGIEVYPHLKVPEDFNGYIYITQLIDTSVKYIHNDGFSKIFNPGKKVADGKENKHYSVYRYCNGVYVNHNLKKCDKIFFVDAPRQELVNTLCKLSYQANFDTYFQYSEGDKPFMNFKKLCSFQWSLKFEAVLYDKWIIESQQNSSEDSITKSFCKYNDEEGIDLTDIDEISDLYEKFRSTYS